MLLAEFDLIKRYFSEPPSNVLVNQLGVGDDCALMTVPAGYELAITTDTMVAGVHFFADAEPRQLGYKLLAISLSDLAAMGASPVSALLALTIPKVDEDWLAEFARGLKGLASQFSVDIIGGDTTSGHLTLTLQALGLIPRGQALKRSGAKVGDFICVTGCLGDAGLGLKIEQGYPCASPQPALQQLHQPEPKIHEGLAIRGYASSCIDLSDGIAADLRHILQRSKVGATLDWDKIPRSSSVNEYINKTGDWLLPLSAGDDYQLCFTVSPDQIDHAPIECTQIGVVEAQSGLRIHRAGVSSELEAKGFEHFS